MAEPVETVLVTSAPEDVRNGDAPAGDDPGSVTRRPPPTAGPEQLASAFPGHPLSLSTRSVHADDYINSHRAVAPPLHVSTTYRYSSDPDKLVVWENADVCAPFSTPFPAPDSTTTPREDRIRANHRSPTPRTTRTSTRATRTPTRRGSRRCSRRCWAD